MDNRWANKGARAARIGALLAVAIALWAVSVAAMAPLAALALMEAGWRAARRQADLAWTNAAGAGFSRARDRTLGRIQQALMRQELAALGAGKLKAWRWLGPNPISLYWAACPSAARQAWCEPWMDAWAKVPVGALGSLIHRCAPWRTPLGLWGVEDFRGLPSAGRGARRAAAASEAIEIAGVSRAPPRRRGARL